MRGAEAERLTAAAGAVAGPIGRLGAGFMSDPSLAATGAQLGYVANDFYFAGRAGVLGDVDADVATAALVFFEPTLVRTSWVRSAAVQPRREAARSFAECAARWADHRYSDAVDWARLSELADRVVTGTSRAGAPLFAGWLTMPVGPDAPARAQHALNALRELRMAVHAAAVIAHGLRVDDAVRFRSGHMLSVYGWSPGPPSDPDAVPAKWAAAERATDAVMGTALGVLGDDLDELVALCEHAGAVGLRRPV